MPTIAEIIAAKKAGATTSKPAPAESLPIAPTAGVSRPESISEKLESEAALNRIDPPGKYQARQAAGLILRAEAAPVPAPHQPAQEPVLRNLSKTSGEGLDMTPPAADAETATWHAALNGFESDLVVMRDPAEAEVCWLAVRPLRPGLPPILLHRLPWTIWEHPATIRPEDIPY